MQFLPGLSDGLRKRFFLRKLPPSKGISSPCGCEKRCALLQPRRLRSFERNGCDTGTSYLLGLSSSEQSTLLQSCRMLPVLEEPRQTFKQLWSALTGEVLSMSLNMQPHEIKTRKPSPENSRDLAESTQYVVGELSQLPINVLLSGTLSARCKRAVYVICVSLKSLHPKVSTRELFKLTRAVLRPDAFTFIDPIRNTSISLLIFRTSDSVIYWTLPPCVT